MYKDKKPFALGRKKEAVKNRVVLTCHLDRYIMKFIHQKNHFFYFLCFCIMQSIAIPTKEEAHITDQQDSNSLTTPTTTQFSSTSNGYVERRPFDLNLKVIAILIACIIFVFGVTRLCLMFCNSSRSSNNVPSNRRMSVVRPQVATIELNQFKPDIPPAYAEAMANNDIDDSKLPSYDELRHSNT